MSYVSSRVAAKHFDVDISTLRRWADAGKIEHIVTAGGHRRYLIKPPEPKTEAGKIIYARVSSKKQDGDLQNQVKYLQQRYPNYEVITDIGSGINSSRIGFRTVLERLFKGNIREVVVSSGDRFSRFGFPLFVWIFEQFSAKLVSVAQETRTERTQSEELADDLMEIITVFTARYCGSRRYGSSDMFEETEDLPERPVAEAV